MSRNLPEFPNLDYLRRKAKVRLKQLQQQDSAARLAQAQLEIAREYGFPSWPKLKAHIESLPPSPKPVAESGAGAAGGTGGTVADSPGSDGSSPGLFQRFSLRARRLIFFARYFAGQQESDNIEIRHMLLGLMEEDGDWIRKILSDSAVIESVRKRIAVPVTTKTETLGRRSIPLSVASRDVIGHAAEEADRLEHATIETGHFWLALLRDEEFPAIAVLAEILKQRSVSLDTARREVIRNLGAPPPEDA